MPVTLHKDLGAYYLSVKEGVFEATIYLNNLTPHQASALDEVVGQSVEPVRQSDHYIEPEVSIDPHAMIMKKGHVYGSFHVGFDAYALVLTAILENHYQQKLPHPVPGHLIGLMMAGQKVVRASAPNDFNDDNYVDAHAYMDMARVKDDRSPYIDIKDLKK